MSFPLSKKETDLFDSIRDLDFENFLLLEIRGRPIICSDLSEDQDGSEIVPLYGRLSDSETEALVAALDEEQEQEEEDRAPRRPAKVWTLANASDHDALICIYP